LIKSTQKAITSGLRSSSEGKLYKPDDDNADDDGFIADPNKPGKQAVQYQAALAQAIAGGPNTRQWKARAKQLVDAAYKVGENGRPYPPKQGLRIATTNAKTAYSKAIPFEDAVATAVEKAGGTIPEALIRRAFKSVYYSASNPYSPVPGSPHFEPTDEEE
jgi:hypothetical protein